MVPLIDAVSKIFLNLFLWLNVFQKRKLTFFLLETYFFYLRICKIFGSFESTFRSEDF